MVEDLDVSALRPAWQPLPGGGQLNCACGCMISVRCFGGLNDAYLARLRPLEGQKSQVEAWQIALIQQRESCCMDGEERQSHHYCWVITSDAASISCGVTALKPAGARILNLKIRLAHAILATWPLRRLLLILRELSFLLYRSEMKLESSFLHTSTMLQPSCASTRPIARRK